MLSFPASISPYPISNFNQHQRFYDATYDSIVFVGFKFEKQNGYITVGDEQ